MSSRQRIVKHPVVINGDMSQATVTSAATIIQDMSLFSYSVVWAGSSPVGSVAVQTSNDYAIASDGAIINAGNWGVISFTYNSSGVSSVAISGNTGNVMLDAITSGAYAVRLVYTKTSGTGTMNVNVNAKCT